MTRKLKLKMDALEVLSFPTGAGPGPVAGRRLSPRPPGS